MIEIFILSLIQGVTEFLPISSSSHLIIFSDFLNFKDQSLSIDVSLHIGSFAAVLTYFHKDIRGLIKNKFLFFKIFISSLPIMIIGYYLVDSGLINKVRNLETIAWMTIIFGLLLYFSDKFKLTNQINDNFNYKSAIFIGIFQILALIPGVSRSGIAITAARFLNFKRVDSAKISFLISIPILGAVSIFGLKNLIFLEDDYLLKLNIISIILSFVFSYITIKFFLLYISKFNLNLFVFYRILLGIGLLVFSYS
mgnify:CR=1 FL=1